MRWRFRRGRAAPGLAVALLGAAPLAVAAGCAGDAGRGPAGEPLADYRPAQRTAGEDGLTVSNFGPRERLLIHSDPGGPVRLLFMEGRAASSLPGGRAAWPDADGARVIVFDERGTVAAVHQGPPLQGPPLARPVFVAAPGDEVWAVEGDGSALVFRDGAPHGWLAASPPAPAAGGSRGLVPAARTFLEFELAPVRPGDPLIWILDAQASVTRTVGTVEVPENGILGRLVNTGWVALDEEGGVYFAHGLEPELRRYDPEGRLRWRSTRPLDPPPGPPRLVAPRGTLEVEFTPVHYGIAIGLDGQAYVLGAADSAGTPDHLYVFDRDGVLVRAGPVPGGHALFADARGRVYALPASDALARTGEPERAVFPPFALPALLGGGTIDLERYRGRIVVVNFWASWCGPCREEMPALDAYARRVDTAQVAVIGLNDDVDPGDALAFLAELGGVSYPSGEGRGRLRARYGYRGLPYTVILDRELRIAKAIYGFGTSIRPVQEAVSALAR